MPTGTLGTSDRVLLFPRSASNEMKDGSSRCPATGAVFETNGRGLARLGAKEVTRGPNENHDAKNQRAYMHGLQRNGFPGGKPARVGNSQDLPSQVSGLRGKGKNYGRQLRGQFNADEGAMDAA
jgi:hypothetical protein